MMSDSLGFDAFGNVTIQKKINPYWGFTTISLFEYDDQNRRTRYADMNTERVTFEYLYESDSARNLATETVHNYDEEGGLERTRTYRYEFDDKGNWIKRTAYEQSVVVSCITRDIKYF
tara:strand:+ start:45716 stop:46069 length:354 start_codon:yes stop_codon:yes gene_type:complete